MIAFSGGHEMRKKRWIVSTVILIIILFMSELVMWCSGKVGVLNTA